MYPSGTIFLMSHIQAFLSLECWLYLTGFLRLGPKNKDAFPLFLNYYFVLKKSSNMLLSVSLYGNSGRRLKN